MTVPGASKRVLLIGAYANGNVGDMYQADAIASELAEIERDIAVFSVSPEERAHAYPTECHTALPTEIMSDADALNSFDLILVGGGGLLATPHAFVTHPDWLDGVETPLCGVSLGCAPGVMEMSRAFIERCDKFSVRDEYSAHAVSLVRDDVEIVMDPILVGRSQLGGDPARREHARGIACVAGRLLSVTEPFYLDLQARVLTSKADAVISINEDTDRRSGFDGVFSRPVHYLRSVSDLHHLVTARALCISERYHGCILALRWNVPCFGLALRSRTVTSKITELYERLGLDDCLIRRADTVDRSWLARASRRNFDFPHIAATLAEERLKLRAYLATCLAR
jgi:polysaccharide pyruvyl transferase WcaK-like protein